MIRHADCVERLRRRADFLAVASGLRSSGPSFALQARDRADQGAPRVGYTVSKKVGTAVERNRVKRRLREVVRRCAAPSLQSGYDYVLIGRRKALGTPFAGLVSEFQTALQRLKHSPAPGATARSTPPIAGAGRQRAQTT